MNGKGDRELAPARWEMPKPPQFVKGDVDYGFTNIRNVNGSDGFDWQATARYRRQAFRNTAPNPDPVPKKSHRTGLL